MKKIVAVKITEISWRQVLWLSVGVFVSGAVLATAFVLWLTFPPSFKKYVKARYGFDIKSRGLK